MSRYKNYIAPYFKEILIKNITPSQCQKLLDEVPGNGKTADEIYSLMNCIFKCATIICFPELRHIRNVFKKILPNHKLYDLRTTFYTRCKECGIADAARNEFVGHSMGKLENAYTDLSDEFLLREGEKFSY